VPAYVVAGAERQRDSGEVELRRGSTFAMELRPSARVEGAVGARGFLLRGDVVRPWDAPFVVDRDGTVRVAGAVDALFAGVPSGPLEIAVAVGRPENLPTAPRDVLRERERAAAGGSVGAGDGRVGAGDGRVGAGSVGDTGRAAWHLVLEHGRLEP
jgi:hypothetical protein